MRPLLLLFAALALAGCGTVHQDSVSSSSASFDGNDQNSGIIAKRADGYVVTGHFRDRYNALVSVYGKSRLSDKNKTPIFAPSLEKDQGVTPFGYNFIFTKEAMRNMVVLSDLKRRGAAP